VKRCPVCGEENTDRARFCQACGAALAAEETVAESRKVVTVLFVDVMGSTALGERLDPEALRKVMGRYFDEMAAVVERHGGTVEKFIGDAVMAVFGIPRVHEDDALRAVRAAIEMREALAGLNVDLERDHGAGLLARIGVNTGEVVAGDPAAGQRLVTGDAVNVAARLEQAAEPGHVLIGGSTHRLVRDAVEVEPVAPLELKGKAEPVEAFRLLGVRAGIEGHVRRLDSPMVGRRKELELLLRAFERAIDERRSHLFTLLGPAGVGKSRLIQEFLDSDGVRRSRVLRGRCLSYGEGVTFFPLAEVVQAAAGIAEGDGVRQARTKLAARLADLDEGERIEALVSGLFGWAEPGPTEESFWAVRKLLEREARDGGMILVVDDVHWAEPTFLDLIEHLADWTRDVPLLIVCVARPELLDVRGDWGGGKVNATSILLEPLGGEEASALIDNLLGRADIPATARERILEAADGNPLFVEEMLAMLIDDGLLRFEGGAWHAADDLAQVTVPPTIQLLLAARLDRLDGEERAVIERGAVEGKVFHVGAVSALASEQLRPRVPSRLLALARKELIRPDRAEFAGEDAFRFRHLLIRDAAYQAMPKEQRADLHERFAAWLERAAGERLAEYEEILGHHLEQAYRYRVELGAVDEGTDDLRLRAGSRLLGSAARAHARGDFATAGPLADRAADLLDGAERASALLMVAAAHEHDGDFHGARRAASASREEAEAAGDGRGALLATLIETAVQGQVDPTVTIAGQLEVFRRVLAEFERMGDEVGIVRSLNLIGRHEFFSGRSAEALAVAERLLPGIHLLDVYEQVGVLTGLWTAAYFGPVEVTDGFRLLERIRGSVRGMHAEANLHVATAGLLGLTGRFDEAREEFARGRAIFAELGSGLRLIIGGQVLAETEMLAGRFDEAERILRDMLAAYDELGETGFNSTAAALLAYVLCWQSRFDEAEGFADRSRELAAEDDVASHNEWRVAHALVLSSRGEHSRALETVDEAIAIIETTDYLHSQGESFEARGDVLAAAGREDEAADAFRTALDRFESKGILPAAARVRERLAALGR
jgi:class 3 adenylate cyclase/tetratricopeptide (TPR) repeat protein